MIVPMKKVCLVVQNKYKEESLGKLRGIGVIHLEDKSISSDKLTKLLEKKNKVDNAISLLSSYFDKLKKNKKNAKNAKDLSAQNKDKQYRRSSDYITPDGVPLSEDAVNSLERSDLTSAVLNYAEKRKSLQDRISMYARELTRIGEWGEFNPKDIESLSQQGVKILLYKFSKKDFAELDKGIDYIKLREDKNSIYAAVLNNEIPKGEPFTLPEHSINAINNLVKLDNAEIEQIEKLFESFAERMPVLIAERENVLKSIEFETAHAGMEVLESEAESAISWISGFVPVDELGLLKRGASENNWALAVSDPGEDDFVPTKLKNNRFSRLLRPLTNFLEVTPGYNEVDISGWFLFFFVIFFGMIFGDAAYGGLLVIVALLGILKTLKKGVPAILKLLLLLGTSNFLWGVLTCSWFGMDANDLPSFFHKISLPIISNANPNEGIVQQNLMILCFSLALIQLSIGHIIAIIRTRSLKILGEVGSILMIIGMYGLVLVLIASNEARDLSEYIPMMPCVYVLGAGFLLSFIFSNYEGKIGKSVLDSCKNIISVILGIANIFSDIMSYIRLWAVGLAGAAIAGTINAMAGPMIGTLAWFIFGLVLVLFGHGLNLVLNALSVLVHGVRLNTLEFSSHVGLNWAGKPYKPFSDK